MKRYGKLFLVTLLASLVSAALYFAACGVESGNNDQPCKDEFDCQAGYRCINNVCKQYLRSDAGHGDRIEPEDAGEEEDSGVPVDGGSIKDGGIKDGGGGGGDGGTGVCGPSNCNSGCCDSKGKCQPGADDLVCGNNGNQCSDCKSKSQLCISKQCGTLGDCAKGTCIGCCDEFGVCKQGTGSSACGMGGKPCDNCSVNGASCQSGHCQGSGYCNMTCMLGCCDGYQVCHGKNSDNACFSGTMPGEICVDCTLQGKKCIGGVCKTPTCGKTTCPNGCCDEYDSCSDGKFDKKCGTGGAKCLNCIEDFKLLCTDQKCQ